MGGPSRPAGHLGPGALSVPCSTSQLPDPKRWASAIPASRQAEVYRRARPLPPSEEVAGGGTSRAASILMLAQATGSQTALSTEPDGMQRLASIYIDVPALRPGTVGAPTLRGSIHYVLSRCHHHDADQRVQSRCFLHCAQRWCGQFFRDPPALLPLH